MEALGEVLCAEATASNPAAMAANNFMMSMSLYKFYYPQWVNLYLNGHLGAIAASSNVFHASTKLDGCPFQ
jgi:hypothetical protein